MARTRRWAHEAIAMATAVGFLAMVGGYAAATGDDDETQSSTDFMYAKCSAHGIPGGSPFWGNLGTTLHQLVENTAYADFDFKTQNGGSRCPAFGQAICDKQVVASPEDCTDCLAQLSNHIWAACNNAIGAEVKFAACSIRYEQYRF